MSALSDFYEDAFLNWIRGTTFPAAPANVYIALFDGSPSDTGGGGTELTNTIKGTSNRNAMAFDAPSAGEIDNSAQVVITSNAAGGATASHFAIFDAITAGNLIVHGALGASKTIVAGDEVRFNAGSLTISID